MNTTIFWFSPIFWDLFCLCKALERGPLQVNPAPDDEAGSSGAAEQNPDESENMEVRGGRFSKSAEERQKMLKQRQEELLQQARRLESCSFDFSAS